MLSIANNTTHHDTHNRQNRFILIISLLFVVMLSIPQAANATGYIKFDGVDGESKHAEHEEWIDVLSIDWGTHAQQAKIKGQKLMIKTKTGIKQARNGQYKLRDGRMVSVKNGRIVKLQRGGTKSMKPVRKMHKPAAVRKGNVETEFKVEKGE